MNISKIFTLNNECCYKASTNNIEELRSSKKQLKILLNEPILSSHVPLYAILTNNLATIYLKKRKFLKAYKFSEIGLFKLEPIIFKQMRDAIQTNKNSFVKDLIVLLQGYLNYAKCLGILQTMSDKITDTAIKTQILNRNPSIFYKNGHKLSSKFLGSDSYLARKFLNYLNNNNNHNENIRYETNNDEHFFDSNMKFPHNTEPNQKKAKNITEILESETQEEDSFDQTFEKNHKKEFRIKKKTHHRNYKSQIEFGTTSQINKYNERDYYEIIDKMKEMEENLRRIQELRERYKQEKQLIENDYQYIKTKSLEFYQQNRIPATYNQWALPQQSSFMNNKPFIPNPLLDNNHFWYPQNMNSMDNNANFTNNNINPTNLNLNNYSSPIHLNNVNPILTDTNRGSGLDSDEKNNEIEKILISLKHDKDKILKQSHEKDKEIQKLKEEINRKMQKRSNNSSENNSLPNFDEPFQQFTPNNQEPLFTGFHKKSNSHTTKPIKPSTDLPINAISPIVHKKTNTKETTIAKKEPIIHLESPPLIKNNREVTVHSFNSVASLPPENLIKNQQKNNNNAIKDITTKASVQNLSTLEKSENNTIAKKTALLKSESNKSLVKLISLMERQGSIKNIKTENLKRNSIMEQKININTPFEVFKTLAIPKFSVVKKKIILESEILLFEFRTLINEQGQSIYRIEGYNLETAKAMKTAIMKEDQLKKVLDSINYEDIVPLTHPLKSIFKYIDFVKHFIMPFIGVNY